MTTTTTEPLRALIGWAIRRRVALAVLAALALLLGSWQALRAPLDVFPEFVPPQLSIQTAAPGWSSAEVEQWVTRPIEAALGGVLDLATLHSESIGGLSVITVTFNEHADPRIARQGVSERLSDVGARLPAGVGAPQVSPLTSSTMDLLKFGLVSDTVDDYTLRDLADWTLKPRLLAVPGVARVSVFGGSVRQLSVELDPTRLQAAAIGVPEVLGALREALIRQPGGELDLPAQRVSVQSVAATDASALTALVLRTTGGAALHLGDLASVRPAAAAPIGDALIQGRRGVLLTVSGQYGANTLAVTTAVEALFAEWQLQLNAQGVQLITPLHRPATFIETALDDLATSLVLGSLLILALLVVFLRSARAVLIAMITIPLSLLAGMLVLVHTGATLNTMTLGGFAVALGVLIDDAVIDIENIARRLHLNAQSLHPLPRLTVILDASMEIRASVLYATWVVLLAFLPILALDGVQGRLLQPLAAAFACSVLASLLVALTVTPALCALALGDDPLSAPPWMARLQQAQERAMRWVDRHLRLIAALALAALIVAALVFSRLGGEFFPMFREGHFVLQVATRLPGTSIAEMRQLGAAISADVLTLDAVASVEQQIGRAELGEDTWGTHRSEFHVELKADSTVDQTVVQEQLREILAHYPGVQTEVLTFLGDRLSETLTGDTAQVSVRVYGPDLATLDALAGQIAALAGTIEGVADLRTTADDLVPTVDVHWDAAALGAYGIRPSDAASTLAVASSGAVVGQVPWQDHSLDVVARLPEWVRAQPLSLLTLPIASVDGATVPLARVAQLQLSNGRYGIQHEGGQRVVSVGFNIRGRAAGPVVNELRAKVADAIVLPPRTLVEYVGLADAERHTQWALGSSAALAVVLIALCLAAVFRRRAFVWLVLANLPFALSGAVAAMAISGIGLSIGAVVGMVTVFGISARNAILLLAHYEHRVLVEGDQWTPDLAWSGARERLRPVLMTALLTAMGLVPLALGLNRAGHEIEAPMAIAVLGGLCTSTLLTLLVLPAIAQRLWRPRAPSQRNSLA